MLIANAAGKKGEKNHQVYTWLPTSEHPQFYAAMEME